MNEILSGKYSGSKLVKDKERNVAFLTPSYTYIVKNTAERIEIINGTNTTAGDPLYGAIIGGATGAIVASSTVYEALIEICWKDGQTSIAKVDKEMLEALMIGVRKVYSEEQLERLTQSRIEKEKKDKEGNFNTTVWMLLIGIGWIALVYFIFYG